MYSRWMPPSCSTELYHHGIRGMKWGVRKDHSPVTSRIKRVMSSRSFNTAVKVGKKAVGMMLTVGTTVALYNVGVPAVLGAVKGASMYASPIGQAALANAGINSLPQAILESGRASVTAAWGFAYQTPVARKSSRAAMRLTYV